MTRLFIRLFEADVDRMLQAFASCVSRLHLDLRLPAFHVSSRAELSLSQFRSSFVSYCACHDGLPGLSGSLSGSFKRGRSSGRSRSRIEQRTWSNVIKGLLQVTVALVSFCQLHLFPHGVSRLIPRSGSRASFHVRASCRASARFFEA